jgi:DNA-binding GntR family transcriptional regulator
LIVAGKCVTFSCDRVTPEALLSDLSRMSLEGWDSVALQKELVIPREKVRNTRVAVQRERSPNLADSVYEQLREELFGFCLLPGDRFTESEIANRTGASRTPVRQALYRLQREGFLDVSLRNGWEVRQLNFAQLDALYELRVLLEQASVRRMKDLSPRQLDDVLKPLEICWCVPASQRGKEAFKVAVWDEEFHCSLVAASGNSEYARVHLEVTEKIRIVRRLDFTEPARITATYKEHSSILEALRQGDFESVTEQLAVHIETSRKKARQITLLRLQNARISLKS